MAPRWFRSSGMRRCGSGARRRSRRSMVIWGRRTEVRIRPSGVLPTRGREERGKCLLNIQGQLNRVKAAGYKGVIFAAFIDHAEIAVSSSLIVRDHTIQFPHLERGWITFIV